MSDRVFLTGGSGFVGSHILRELLAAGYAVRALVRPGSAARIREQDVEVVEGDVRDAGKLVRELDGCRYVVHAAALYSLDSRDRAEIAAVNVTATAGLMAAAHVSGVERAVLTSSSATIGHERNGKPADESCYPDRSITPARSKGDYHQSKLEQERAAFAGRVPVVAVLPTAPVGPGDWKPTPTGKLVLDFLRGKIAAKAPGSGGMNLVAVEDVARAHVAALQGGRVGERYVVGGENLSMDAIWEMLADISGKPMPAWRAPYALALAFAYADRARCALDRNATPFAPLEGVRMSRERMYADSSKAQRELNHRPSPVRAALERAADWYRANRRA
ncbi:MAG TPA: NAD-dependent epimerase/dehydratase family protein [Candidatus Baltobacteraceae bacterium]|nr:NAD-dependent epimerase/dehydratase family protein [Candidatus Baltobacteraceae bacterium]